MLLMRLLRWCQVLFVCLLAGCAVDDQFGAHQTTQQSLINSGYQTQDQGYLCHQASRYRSTVVGTGHCVSLIQQCSGAPLTRYWREGESVRGQPIRSGTVIATFDNGRYPNKAGWHAAIYISQSEKGIWVWDQWVGKPVHKRLIRFKNGQGTPNNDGDAYSIVR